MARVGSGRRARVVRGPWATPSSDFTARIEIGGDDGWSTSRVEAVIQAASIDTGNQMRDGHLKSPDFLDVVNYPQLTYLSSGISLAGEDRWTVHGDLRMHGVSRPVDLDLRYLGTGSDPWGGTRAAFSATAELRRDDFAMHYNQVIQAGISAIGTKLAGGMVSSSRCQRASASSITGSRSRTRTMGW